MKRFKDCAILCNPGQSVSKLLLAIEERCIKLYDVEKLTAFNIDDTLSVTFDKGEFPICRLILLASEEENSVKIVNIVPSQKSGLSSLEMDLYNRILDVFRDDIFIPIEEAFGNKIQETKADYTIEDVIPESSYLLKRWLNAYPLSGHKLDQERWFDFLISLNRNDEYLSLDDFSKYIKENYSWQEEDIEKFELKLEEELALLEYYNNGIR